jgi:hypothetical protein
MMNKVHKPWKEEQEENLNELHASKRKAGNIRVENFTASRCIKILSGSHRRAVQYLLGNVAAERPRGIQCSPRATAAASPTID